MSACCCCPWIPRMPRDTTEYAATMSQCCGACGTTLHAHSDDHPHATLYCDGFAPEAWPSEQHPGTPVPLHTTSHRR
jgi:hypothetical protein